jgi:hypothetical protein
METSKIIALLKFLGESNNVDEIIIGSNNRIEIDSEEYLVLTDSEADEEFSHHQDDLYDEMGINSLSDWAFNCAISDFVDKEWFEEAMKESYESYVNDIESESSSSDEYENRLEEEIAENSAENKEDYIDFLCSVHDSAIDWYEESFGKEALTQVIIENDLIDKDALFSWIKTQDGRGSSLAGYDGVENEQNGYYIYRTN